MELKRGPRKKRREEKAGTGGKGGQIN